MNQDARRRRYRRLKVKRLRRRRTLVLGGMFITVAGIAWLGIYLYMRHAVNKAGRDVIWNHVYIGEADMSGMRKGEAVKALEEYAAKLSLGTVCLAADDTKQEFTLESLGFGIQDPDTLVKKAVSLGKSGSVWSRFRILRSLKKEKKTFEVTYMVDSSAVRKTLSEKMPELKNAAKDATIRRENGAFIISDGVRGEKIDLDEAVKILESYLNKEWQVRDAGKVTLRTIVDEPEVTREDLEQIKDALGTFSTGYAAGTNRGKNVETGTSNINGAVLMPGEEYSASEGMGPTDAEHGYLEAASYLDGQTVDSYGGGVCQVSTTLYNAVLLAELDVTERWPHSMLVGYVKPSMDAAIAEGYKDLKFKNNTDAPVYIEGITSRGVVTFTIYGKESRPADRKIAFTSEVTEQNEEKKQFVATGDAVGTLKKAESAHMGMKARLWKTVTRGGEEISKDVINKSTYRESPSIWNVGTGTDNAGAKQILEEAISTQAEAAIMEAIARAKAILGMP